MVKMTKSSFVFTFSTSLFIFATEKIGQQTGAVLNDYRVQNCITFWKASLMDNLCLKRVTRQDWEMLMQRTPVVSGADFL